MKIRCTCGEIIRDQTDFLPNKAYVIGDRDYFDFLDRIDAAIENPSDDKQGLCMGLRAAEPGRRAWECVDCGRLYFDNANGDLVEYLPENGRPNAIFDRPGSKITR